MKEKMSKILEVIPTKLVIEIGGMPPMSATKTVPQWYRDMPQFALGDKDVILRDGLTNSTVKRCVPFLDAMTAGYSFVLANDVQVWWKDGSPKFEWASETRDMVSFHDKFQISGMPVPENCYETPIKWVSEYILKTPKDYSLYCMHPSNRFDLPFTTISGFVETDLYESPIQFPFFIKEGWTGIIEAGTPVAQLIPIKREDWLLEIKPHDEKRAYKGLQDLRRKIERSYKKQYWARKSYK